MTNTLFLIKSYYEDFYFDTEDELRDNFELFNCNDNVTTLSILDGEEYREIFSLNLEHVGDSVSYRLFIDIISTINGLMNETDTTIQDIVVSCNEYGNFAIDYIVFNRSIPHGIKEIFRPEIYIDYYAIIYDDSYDNYRYESNVMGELGSHIYSNMLSNSDEMKKYGEVSGIFTYLIDYEKFGYIMSHEAGWKYIGTHLYKK